MNKRILSLILALTMIFGMMPSFAMEAAGLDEMFTQISDNLKKQDLIQEEIEQSEKDELKEKINEEEKNGESDNKKIGEIESSEKDESEEPEETLDVYTTIVKKTNNDKYEIISNQKKVTINNKIHNEGLTVLGSLQATTDNYDKTGIYVTSIEEIKNNTPGGWRYIVNDKEPGIDAHKEKLENGDKVIWFYGFTGINEKVPTWEEIERIEEESSGITFIKTADDLIELSNSSWSNQVEDWAKNYKLANDIDMKEASIDNKNKMKPIGSDSRNFTGIFDGNGYKIQNLEFIVSNGKGGLFHTLSKAATVKNLELENANLKLYGESGALVGENNGTIENCSVKDSTITATSSVVGGIVGINNGTIEKTFINNSTIKYDNKWGTTSYGGLVGRNTENGKIKESYSNAIVIEAKKWIGGLIGWNYGSIENSYSSGEINGTEEIGGLVGRSDRDASIKNSYANIDVTASTSGSGFIGGLNSGGGTVSKSFYNSDKKLPEENTTDIEGFIAKTSEELKFEELLNLLNDGKNIWGRKNNINDGFPYIIAIAPEADEQKAPIELNVETMIVNYDKESYSFKKHKDITKINVKKENLKVLDILEAGKEIIPYKSKIGDYGEFIESIDGIEAQSPDGWMFTINDKAVPVGVSRATVEDGDKIFWYYGSPLNNYKAPKWNDFTSTMPEDGEDNDILEGKGTAEEPYLIKSPKDLKKIMNNPKAHYKVNNSIDLSEIDFEPIGTLENPFMGTFDGNNQEISNLKINKDENSKNIGFFGVINDAKVINVKITDANIIGGSRLGILAGYSREDENGASLIGNCHVSGKIKALGEDFIKATRLGGLVGINDGNNTVDGTASGSYVYSVIDNCSANVEVAGKSNSGQVGGLVGWNRGIIMNSNSSGYVKGGNTTGGLVGSNWEQIYKSYATGNVEGRYSTGGFVGSNNLFTVIEDSYSTGNVIGSKARDDSYFGGFAGVTSGKIKNSVSTGSLLTGWSWNGGFAGSYNGNNIEKDIVNSYGNSIDYLGNRIKGLGNVVDSSNPNYDKYSQVGITFDEAKVKLVEILDVTLSEKEESQDQKDLKAEMLKYEDSVVIPNTIKEKSDITKQILKLKDGKTADSNILLIYSQKEYKGYITNKVPTGQYTLLKQNESENNKDGSVTPVFVKNGEFATKEIKVIIESTSTISKKTLEDRIKEVKDMNLNKDNYTEKSWSLFSASLKKAEEIVKKDKLSLDEIKNTLSDLNSKLENLIEKESTNQDKVYEAIVELRSYYSQKDKFTFRSALGYNYTSENLENDLIEINSKLQIEETPDSANANAYAKNILGLIAAGHNPYNYNNKDYVTSLVEAQNERGKFIIEAADDDSTRQAFIVLALDMAKANYNKDKAMEALLGYQDEEGGFGGTDQTGMVLTALGEHKGKSEVQTAIDKGLNFLKGEQDEDTGGFIAWGNVNPYSASAVIQGLIAVGEDPMSEEWTKNGKNVVDSLLSFYKDGKFENDMASEQAFIALADVYRRKSMFNELKYNQNPVISIVIEEPNIEKIIEGDTLNLYANGYDKDEKIVAINNVVWTSSDEDIATIDQKGKLITKKPGKVNITVKIKGTEIENSIELLVLQKEFKVEYIGDISVKKGKQANAKIRIKNLTDDEKLANLIIGLYEKNTNKLLNYSTIETNIEGKKEIELSTGFLAPNQGEHYIKAFVWEGLETQNIIIKDSKSIEVTN